MRSSVYALALLALSAHCLLSEAADAPRQAPISIERQDLATALVRLAAQTGCQFFAPQANIRGIVGVAVHGTLTVEQALKIMLAGTGLSYALAPGTCTFYVDSPEALAHRQIDKVSDNGGLRNNARGGAAPSGGEGDPPRTVLGDMASPGSGPSGLEEVIVTATKRAVAAESLPTTLQVITGEQLRQLGATDFQDYAGQVAGVSFIDMGISGPKITMRGLSTTNFSESQATVGIYVDETPVTDAGGAPAAFVPAFNLKLLDIDRIEILKGPQGTLYGAGALGGAIRIITNQPDTQKYTGFAEASGSVTQSGGVNDEVAAAANFPLLTDTLAVRVLAYDTGNGGYIDDESPLRHVHNVNDDHTTGGRIAMLFSPNADLRVTATITHQDANSGGASIETVGAGDLVQLRAAPENFSDQIWMYNLLTEYDLPFAHLVWSTSYVDRQTRVPFDITDGVGSLFPGQAIQQNSDTGSRDKSSELRLVSTGDSHLQWLGGLYYFDQDRIFEQGIPYVAGADNPLYASIQNAVFREIAVFGELSYALTQRFTATAGVRVFRNDIDFSSTQEGFFEGPTVNIGGGGTDRNNTPKFNLSYRVAPGDLVYASATKGYRRGGVNAVAANELCGGDLAAAGYPNGVPQTYGPDSTWNYELGAKTLWADNKLGVDVATYYIDWTGLPVSIQLPCSITFNVNAAKARTLGSELTLRVQPTSHLSFAGTATYTDATLLSDVPVIDAVSGDRAPTVPRLTFSAAADYSFPLSFINQGSLEGFLHLDANHVGSSLTEYDPAASLPLDAYTLTNFRGGVHFQKWTLEAFVKNIGNERAQLGRFDSGFGNFVAVNQPRTAGLLIRTTW